MASYLSKVANFNLLHLYLAPPLGWPPLNFADIFGVGKLDAPAYGVVLFAWSYVYRFSRLEHRLVSDRRTDEQTNGRTDGQTHGDSYNTRAS